MTKRLIIDDSLIRKIRSVKHRLARKNNFIPHQMAEAVRKKRRELVALFGLPIGDVKEKSGEKKAKRKK